MYILKLFVFLLFSYIYSYCGQLDFIKFENTDKNNAILKAEKKINFMNMLLNINLRNLVIQIKIILIQIFLIQVMKINKV